MSDIKFDPAKKDISGSFKSRAALVAACENMDFADSAYRAWAAKHGVNASTGSIITTAYNPDLLNRRCAALEDQLDEYNGLEPTKLKYALPPNLVRAFDEAMKEGVTDFKVLMISTTRENLHFDLDEMFPRLNLQTVVEASNEEYARSCNHLISSKAPDMAGKLVYKSDWQGQEFDLVAVNPALHYYDERGLGALVEQVSGTNAKRVVFSNIIQNEDPDGDPQWKAQRYSGGIIPLRIPANGELVRLMENAGYRLDDYSAGPATFDVNPTNSFSSQNPALDNFSFIRN